MNRKRDWLCWWQRRSWKVLQLGPLWKWPSMLILGKRYHQYLNESQNSIESFYLPICWILSYKATRILVSCMFYLETNPWKDQEAKSTTKYKKNLRALPSLNSQNVNTYIFAFNNTPTSLFEPKGPITLRFSTDLKCTPITMKGFIYLHIQLKMKASCSSN